jgi:hypothetical protein
MTEKSPLGEYENVEKITYSWLGKAKNLSVWSFLGTMDLFRVRDFKSLFGVVKSPSEDEIIFHLGPINNEISNKFN